jgi:NAD(P)-dependent dehydrogenase (short-subunit alcohol dehydrogenase family)
VSSSPFDLHGKVVVVTGGNSGIGLGMARSLADAGAGVCIWGRSKERNADALDELKGRGATAVALQADVTDEQQVIEAMASTVRQWGRIDACFANAGALGPASASFVDSTMEEWRETLALALDSVYVTMREAAKVLVAQGHGGSLVATSSIGARYGTAKGNHAYASGKAAIIALMNGLAVELARFRIRANAILPGWVDGAMMQNFQDNPALGERVRQRIPMRRWGQPAELGALAVYLAGDGSSWHTGDQFILDGGFHVF